jgi:para-nitrobenzyl esterase
LSSTIVETAYGKVRGVQDGKIFIWRGIPYAKPPVGRLRFCPPEAPEKWGGVRDATAFGPVSMQQNNQIMQFLGNRTDNMSEDCLYLNIWSPGADDRKRPVMVWIHGGAFITGSGSSAIYDGKAFAENGEVVVVTINYRLGALGFLHLDAIGGEDFRGSGNCGILDQVAALKWVQENISAFGGDPDRVTIFGESAGAMSVGILLSLPQAKGLFNQAILESGAAKNVISSERATRVTEKLLTVLDIDRNHLEKLRELPAETIILAAQHVPMMSLVPVVDGAVILEKPEERLAKGSAQDIAVLIGTNKDEYKLFSFFDPIWQNADPETIHHHFKTLFGSRWPFIQEAFGELKSRDDFDRLLTWDIFTYPAIQLAEAQAKNGASVWMYRFDWETPILNGGFGSCHALEIPFVWSTLDQPGISTFTGNAADRFKVSEVMHRAWIAFARNGDPNSETLSDWPKYELNNRATMLFNTECHIVHDPDQEYRKKWAKIEAAIKRSAS